MTRHAPRGLVVLAFAAIVLLLGVNFVAVRISNRELAPFWGGGLRFVVAAVLLAWAVVLLRVPWPRGSALAGAALYGALAFGVNFGLLYWALVRASASLAAIVFSLIPLLTLGLSAAIGLERVRARTLVGALLALVGVLLAFREQLRLDVPAASLVAILGAAVAAAASGVVVKRFPRAHPVSTNAVGMAVGAGMLVAASLLLREDPTLPASAGTWAAFSWLVLSSCSAFVLMVWVLGQWTASAASYTAVLTPFVTIAVASALAGEVVSPLIVAAALVVVAGTWLGATAVSRTPQPPRDERTSSAPPARAR